MANGDRKSPSRLDEVPAVAIKGGWDVEIWAKRDLLIRGQLAEGYAKAFLLFNRRLLGVSSVSAGRFKFLIHKAVKKGLPKDSFFHVVTHDGFVPHSSGSDSWVVEDRFAASTGEFLDLDKHIDSGNQLTKKGTLSGEVSTTTKQIYFETFCSLDNWFCKAFKYPVLVSHGTLLGLCRSGDMIPHDDDFDCLYLSRRSDVAAVVKERMKIMHRMRKAGFNLKVGPSGHIKVRSKGCTVDLMPAWINNDVLYVSGYSAINGASRFVRPIKELRWEPYGPVKVFGNAEMFLEAQYGPTWRTPNPGYRQTFSRQCMLNRKALQPKGMEVEKFGSNDLKKRILGNVPPDNARSGWFRTILRNMGIGKRG